MNLAKYLPAVVSLGALFGLVITAEGCGGNVVCSSCDCDPDACSTGNTTETGTETGTGTGSGTTIPTSPGGVCDIVCDCLGGCAGGDIESCLASFDEGLKTAKEAGCEQEYLAMYACYEENLQCIDGELEYDECWPLIEAADECIKDVPPNAGPCQPLIDQLVEKYNACGIDVETGDFECTEELFTQLDCMTPCVLEASCDVFDGSAPDEEMTAYAECLQPCQ